MKPIVHGLEAEYWGQVDFIYIDRENPFNESAVSRFGVNTQPIFYVLDENGEVLEQWFGGTTDVEIRAILDTYLVGR